MLRSAPLWRLKRMRLLSASRRSLWMVTRSSCWSNFITIAPAPQSNLYLFARLQEKIAACKSKTRGPLHACKDDTKPLAQCRKFMHAMLFLSTQVCQNACKRECFQVAWPHHSMLDSTVHNVLCLTHCTLRNILLSSTGTMVLTLLPLPRANPKPKQNNNRTVGSRQCRKKMMRRTTSRLRSEVEPRARSDCKAIKSVILPGSFAAVTFVHRHDVQSFRRTQAQGSLCLRKKHARSTITALLPRMPTLSKASSPLCVARSRSCGSQSRFAD